MAVTYFVALPFVANDDGELVAGEAQERLSAAAAVFEARPHGRECGSPAPSPSRAPGIRRRASSTTRW